MFYVERDDGNRNWTVMMASPHQIGMDDLRGPPEDSHHNFPPSKDPNHKTAFAGRQGWHARVRFRDTLIEEFVWDKIPLNPLDPESDTVWGWKRTFFNQNAMSPEMGSGQMTFLESGLFEPASPPVG